MKPDKEKTDKDWLIEHIAEDSRLAELYSKNGWQAAYEERVALLKGREAVLWVYEEISR